MVVQSERMVVVSNLPSDVKEVDLVSFCGSIGDLEPGPVSVHKEGGRTARAYPVYREKEGQELALRWLFLPPAS